MRQDVLIKANSRGLYDVQIDGHDFASAQGLESAVPTSLFTDARASITQVQEALNRRGWTGNILYADEDREIGGLLWLLEQARITNDTLNFAKSYAENSLQWLIDDGLARAIRVEVSRTSIRDIVISIDIFTIDNTIQRYIVLWRVTDLTRILAL